jgi:hypothetical protein
MADRLRPYHYVAVAWMRDGRLIWLVGSFVQLSVGETRAEDALIRLGGGVLSLRLAEVMPEVESSRVDFGGEWILVSDLTTWLQLSPQLPGGSPEAVTQWPTTTIPQCGCFEQKSSRTSVLREWNPRQPDTGTFQMLRVRHFERTLSNSIVGSKPTSSSMEAIAGCPLGSGRLGCGEV